MGKNRGKTEVLGGWWWLSLSVVGLMLMGWGVWRSGRGDKVEIEYIEADGEEEIWLWVDVGGAVERPGVYELEEGSRIKDGLIAAGGLADEADRDYVSRMINLAEKVEDGEKVYIPFREEEAVLGVAVSNEGMVNLNTASESQLDTLWGVGQARAKGIIDGRPYASVEEVVERGVLPASVVEKNDGVLTVY